MTDSGTTNPSKHLLGCGAGT